MRVSETSLQFGGCCSSLQLEDTDVITPILRMKKRPQECSFVQSLNTVNGFICFCPPARERSKPHFSLIHPNAFVASEIFFSRILKIWHAVTFPLTVLSMCGVQNRSGFIIPSLPAWAVRVSKLAALPEIAEPKAISSSTPRKLPVDTFVSFSSPSYVSDLTEETFPPFSASFASCPFIKPKSFVSLPGLFL